MLDDLALGNLLVDAADSIAVPQGGPERVLAARDAFSRPRPVRAPSRARGFLVGLRRRPLRAAAALVASFVVVGVVAGIAAGGGGGSQVNGSAEHASVGGLAPSQAPAERGAASTGASGEGIPLAPAGPAGAAGAAQQAVPNLVPSSAQAKVVKNGSMTLRVASVQSTVDQLGVLAQSVGGYVSATSMNVPGGGQPSSADVTLRVPEPQFESFTSRVEALGSPSQVTVSGQDVTSQYSDLKARLQALQSTISQLELIETKAQTIGDILAVEQQISAQQTEADQIQGQINVLDGETTYGSLAVHLVEPQKQKKAAVAPPPPSGISKAWDHARHSFARGVEAVIGALGGIAVFLLFTALLLGLARLGWTALRRRLV